MGAFEEASRAVDDGLKLEKNAGLLMAVCVIDQSKRSSE